MKRRQKLLGIHVWVPSLFGIAVVRFGVNWMDAVDVGLPGKDWAATIAAYQFRRSIVLHYQHKSLHAWVKFKPAGEEAR
jgi:hypothetical protein